MGETGEFYWRGWSYFHFLMCQPLESELFGEKEDEITERHRDEAGPTMMSREQAGCPATPVPGWMPTDTRPRRAHAPGLCLCSCYMALVLGKTSCCDSRHTGQEGYHGFSGCLQGWWSLALLSGGPVTTGIPERDPGWGCGRGWRSRISASGGASNGVRELDCRIRTDSPLGARF